MLNALLNIFFMLAGPGLIAVSFPLSRRQIFMGLIVGFTGAALTLITLIDMLGLLVGILAAVALIAAAAFIWLMRAGGHTPKALGRDQPKQSRMSKLLFLTGGWLITLGGAFIFFRVWITYLPSPHGAVMWTAYGLCIVVLAGSAGAVLLNWWQNQLDKE